MADNRVPAVEEIAALFDVPVQAILAVEPEYAWRQFELARHWAWARQEANRQGEAMMRMLREVTDPDGEGVLDYLAWRWEPGMELRP